MNVLALCAGIGGLELGIGIAVPGGVRTVAYVERESYAAATLVARMEEQALDPAPVWADLTTFDARAWRGTVDLVTAGFPCQPWSAAGRRQGTDDERWIWNDIQRIIRDVRPGWCFLENVPGLVSGGGLEPVLGGLASLGFDAQWGVFSADGVGAPHRRQRVFILARQPMGSQRVSDAYRDGLRHGSERGAGAPRPPDEGDAVARDGDAELADAGRSGLEGHDAAGAEVNEDERRLRGEEGPTAQGGAGVAHGHSEGRGLIRPAHDGPRGGDAGGDDADGCDERVADPDGGRRRPQGDPGLEDGGAHREGAVRLFPPGPDDLEVWARVLSEAPEVEPAVCKLADGSAPRLEYRTDRLRALGNGVVPLQAAVACRVLADRAGWRLR